MSLLHLIWRNLLRKKVRTIFTLLSVLVAFVLFAYLAAIQVAFTLGVDVTGKDRLVVIHKTSLILALPMSHQSRLIATEGVTDVTHATLIYNPGENHVTLACESSDAYHADEVTGQLTPIVLGQNYPDPFNPVTEIVFELAAANSVRLTGFNVKGQRMATLVDENLPAGRHRVHWNAHEATSGVYFYRLEAGDYEATRKMVLLK